MTAHALAYPVGDDTIAGAELSVCRAYRYRLWRIWDSTRPSVLFVMLNPSTADECEDDPTIRRCRGFAHRWGFGGLEVVNLFGYRAATPARLMNRRFVDAVGPDNDAYIWGGVKRCQSVVLAWGAHVIVAKRAPEVLKIIGLAGGTPACIATTAEGHPAHPLYLKRDLTPVPFDAARYRQ